MYGGYDPEPAWLADHPSGYTGVVVEFIPGQNSRPAAVVRLDERLILPAGGGAVSGHHVEGSFLVLKLGHVGTDWATPTPRVHVELCDEQPEAKRWQDRLQGAWVESHATYRIVGGG